MKNELKEFKDNLNFFELSPIHTYSILRNELFINKSSKLEKKLEKISSSCGGITLFSEKKYEHLLKKIVFKLIISSKNSFLEESFETTFVSTQLEEGTVINETEKILLKYNIWFTNESDMLYSKNFLYNFKNGDECEL